MKVEVYIKKEVELVVLQAEIEPRYGEDTEVDGVQDKEGNSIPCREGEFWIPIINIETGIITNWEGNKTAKVHYKVCDAGTYHLLDKDGNVQLTKEGYVPDILDLYNDSYGDYIILNIDESGQIADWNNKPNIEDFFEEN